MKMEVSHIYRMLIYLSQTVITTEMHYLGCIFDNKSTSALIHFGYYHV